MDPRLLELMDAHDDAYTLRKQLAYEFMAVTPTKRTQTMKDALEAAMEAEEQARLALVNLENKLAMEGSAQ